jgi:hypothetical protein
MLSILDLPLEIRYEIYEFALDWPNLKPTFETIKAQNQQHEKYYRKHYASNGVSPKLSVDRVTTPSILLLNRQITAEAQDTLRKKTLVINSPPPVCQAFRKAMDITEFIGDITLQKAYHVLLDMDLEHQDWLTTIETLLDVWCMENSLKSLYVRVKCPQNTLSWIGNQQLLERVCYCQ